MSCWFSSRFFSRLESNMQILPSIHIKTCRLKMFNSYVDWNTKSKCITVWFKMLLHCTSLSLHWSLRKAFLSLIAILWNSVFKRECLFLLCFLLLFFAELFVRLPQTAILLFCISFPWGWSWSLSPVQCHEPPSIVHQVLCPSDLVKDKNGMDLTEVEDIKNRWQEYTEELYKTDLTTQIITMVWSLT